VCGSEFGQPPEYATVSEAKKDYIQQSSTNLLRFAQLNNIAPVNGRTKSLEKLHRMESRAESVTHSSNHGSQVSVNLAGTTVYSAELEHPESGSSEDEAAVNCHYEATQFRSSCNTSQVTGSQSSVYELMGEATTNLRNCSMDANPTTEFVASATDEQALDNLNENTKREMQEEDSNTQRSCLEDNGELDVLFHSAEKESTVQSDEKGGGAHAPTAEHEVKSQNMSSSDQGEENELLCKEDLYDDPSCLDKYNSTAIGIEMKT